MGHSNNNGQVERAIRKTLESDGGLNAALLPAEPIPPTFTRDGIEEQHRFYPTTHRTAWLAARVAENRIELPDNGTVIIEIAGDVYIGELVNGKAVRSLRLPRKTDTDTANNGQPPGKPPVATATAGATPDPETFARWKRLIVAAATIGLLTSVALAMSGCK